MLWDIFCRVVDNLGDAGVCWRLAADLAARGHGVRLVIDDAAPLRLITSGPAATPGLQVLPWPGPAEPGDVAIEAFGCDPPPAYTDAMAAATRPPLWLNLEYLSAEPYVERSHRLPSPQRNGLTKWFFYPGFTPATGGLLREPGLQAQRQAFDAGAWLAAQGVRRRPGERLVSLFCYANALVPALLQTLAQQPTLLLLTPGFAQQQALPAAASSPTPAGLRLHALPWLPQPEFDRLLWSCDLNFVRGEDSLVRALWAGAPFVWQLYPQHDAAHLAKLDAMLALLQLPASAAAVWRAWNGMAAWPGLPPPDDWRAATSTARSGLLAQPDLASQLLAFAQTARPGAQPEARPAPPVC